VSRAQDVTVLFGHVRTPITKLVSSDVELQSYKYKLLVLHLKMQSTHAPSNTARLGRRRPQQAS
jgi:hypothetical protein